MASKETVANLALSHLNQGLAINSLTERSQSAIVVNQFYDVALEMILRKKDWSFARKKAALPLVTVPSFEYLFAYRYPPDCIAIRSMPNQYYPERLTDRMELGSDSDGRLIFCNDVSGVFTYTFKNEVVETYPGDFMIALSYLLASFIAPRLTGGDPFKLGPQCEQKYLQMIDTAAVADYNEQGPVRQAESAFQRARY